MPISHLSPNFYLIPRAFRQTMLRKHLRDTLLATGGWILACGEGWNIKHRDLGAGVCEVFLERRD